MPDLTPACESREHFVVSPFTPSLPSTRLLFQIPISCGLSRVDSSKDTLSQMLERPRIPTKLSAEARSRPFEAPVITVRLPGESRHRKGTRYIDKERREWDRWWLSGRDRRRGAREKVNDCYVSRVHRRRAWAPRMNRAIAMATKLPPLSSPVLTKREGNPRSVLPAGMRYLFLE